MFLSQKVRKLLLKVAGNIFFQYLTFLLDNSTPFLFFSFGLFPSAQTGVGDDDKAYRPGHNHRN